MFSVDDSFFRSHFDLGSSEATLWLRYDNNGSKFLYTASTTVNLVLRDHLTEWISLDFNTGCSKMA